MFESTSGFSPLVTVIITLVIIVSYIIYDVRSGKAWKRTCKRNNLNETKWRLPFGDLTKNKE